jgi:hypothetical protein
MRRPKAIDKIANCLKESKVANFTPFFIKVIIANQYSNSLKNANYTLFSITLMILFT